MENSEKNTKKKAIEEYKRCREAYIQLIVERERQRAELNKKVFVNDEKVGKTL